MAPRPAAGESSSRDCRRSGADTSTSVIYAPDAMRRGGVLPRSPNSSLFSRASAHSRDSPGPRGLGRPSASFAGFADESRTSQGTVDPAGAPAAKGKASRPQERERQRQDGETPPRPKYESQRNVRC